MVEQQMVDEGWAEEHGANDPLARVRVMNAMTASVVSIPADSTIAEAARLTGGSRFMFYPLVAADGALVAVVSRTAIDQSIGDGRDNEPISLLAEEPKLVALASDLVIDVVHRMHASGIDRCPVIDADRSRRVVGFLSPSDILRIRMRRGAPAMDEFELFE
jgi:CBS domain-containing protein